MFQTTSETTTIGPAAVFRSPDKSDAFSLKPSRPLSSVLAADSSYTVKLVESERELRDWLNLRHRVFKIETGSGNADPDGIETDRFDVSSHHLVAVANETGRIVGGYRLRSAETNTPELGFYSAGEFDLSALPASVLDSSVEIGRACIERKHRHGKVLFLLWKGLARYLARADKRYLFGCCSLFTTDRGVAERAYDRLANENFLHGHLRVEPAAPVSPAGEISADPASAVVTELPKLFKTYLRIGAKVCSRAVIDEQFGTADFFVVFDCEKLTEKYRRMFFA